MVIYMQTYTQMVLYRDSHACRNGNRRIGKPYWKQEQIVLNLAWDSKYLSFLMPMSCKTLEYKNQLKVNWKWNSIVQLQKD